MDCSPPGSSVHGIFQARILEWTAISSSRGSSWHRDGTFISCAGRQILYLCVTGEAPNIINCIKQYISSVQFSSVAQSCPTLCNPMNCSTPGLPVHHQLPEFTQTHIHWVSDAIQLYHPLSSPSSPALNLFQHQGLFKWVSSPYQVAKVLEFQLQHQSYQWTPRTDLL